MRVRGSSLLALSFMFMFTACPADPGPDSASGGSTTDGGSSGGEPTTGDSTGPAEDLNPHELGAQASQACVDAMPGVKEFLTATAAGDAAAATTAYAKVQGFVQGLDTADEQTYDAAITEALAKGDAAGAALAEGHLLSSFARHLRNNLSAVESGAPEARYTAWDDAYCVWNGALKDMATRAQGAVWVPPGDPIVADIDAAFAAGHDGIGGEGAATTIDDWRIPPAKQIIEKTVFRAAQRDLVNLAVGAKMANDPAMAARALGEFGIVRDRLEGRNTPGIALIDAMLAGDPASISGELIAIELDKAFAKRTYNYAKMPADGLGVPSSYKGAVEGRTYAKLIAGGIAAAMMPTDAYLADWDSFVELVRTGSDEAEAMAVSQRLLDTTCAYQTALGIKTCTGSDDEVAP